MRSQTTNGIKIVLLVYPYMSSVVVRYVIAGIVPQPTIYYCHLLWTIKQYSILLNACDAIHLTATT